MFIAVEGGDGTGKTTQVDLLVRWLTAQGLPVVSCRDPGGTQLGEAVRSILLHRDDIPLCLPAEALLYMAARAQLVAEVIRPALAAEKIVVSDRYLLSNVAYQGYGGQLPVEILWTIGRFATEGLLPDLTIVLDMPVEEALQRISREPDRLESRGREFLERVRDGFLQEAVRAADRTVVVRADRPAEEVHAAIVRIIAPLLPRGRSQDNK